MSGIPSSLQDLFLTAAPVYKKRGLEQGCTTMPRSRWTYGCNTAAGRKVSFCGHRFVVLSIWSRNANFLLPHLVDQLLDRQACRHLPRRLPDLPAEILEIGFGSGLNVPSYLPRVRRVLRPGAASP